MGSPCRKSLAPFSVALVLLLVAPPSGLAAEIDKCSPSVDHASERECLERVARLANEELLAAEARLLAAIKQWDEDKEWKDKAIDQLELSVAAFREYQMAVCNFDASLAAGGNEAGDMRAECMYRLATQRTRMLSDLIGWFHHLTYR